MNQSDVVFLFEYNYRANQRILSTAGRISMEQFILTTPFPRGNLRNTLIHILDAEYGWRVLLTEGREVPDLEPADFPSVAAIQARWEEEEAAMRNYLAQLTDDNVRAVVQYTNVEGKRRERATWHGLFQVINHGTQHRSEAAAMLTDFSQSPGNLDFTVFLYEAALQGT
jgi:uncharacterized damage-inducible protein DinB